MSLFSQRSRVCTLRPSVRPLDQSAGSDDEWEELARSGILDDEPRARSTARQEDTEVCADDGAEVLSARGMPAPRLPSPADVTKHNLNHLPYRAWCPHCLAARRANSSHRLRRRGSERSIPLFCSDYCFVKQHYEEQLTVLVGKLYPSYAVFASGCDAKGPDDPVTHRLADFLKASGVSKMVYKSDQEPALKATIEQALKQVGRTGIEKEGDDFLQLVPEYSAVGESPSNGRAERAIQTIEDMIRTYLHALEHRIGKKVDTQWPVVRWLVEHAANMVNRFTTNPDGVSPYAALHGRNAQDRQVEFGEKVFYFVPKRARSKLDLRWRLGTYLGSSSISNECFVSNVDGEVLKLRSVARVVF